MAFSVFKWRGEKITNIKEFCKEHNSDLVKVEITKTELFGNRTMIVSKEIEFWPSVFLDNLRIEYSGVTSTIIKQIERIPVSEIK